MGAAILTDMMTEILIPVAAVVGIAFALVQWLLVSTVKLSPEERPPVGSDKKNGHADSLIEEEEGLNDHNVAVKCFEIQSAISEGATSFLFTKYQYVGVFMAVFAAAIFVFLGSVECFYHTKPAMRLSIARTSTVSQNLQMLSLALYRSCSVLSPVVSGFLGMKIATYANARTTLEAMKGVGKAFITAFRSGAVMDFLLASKFKWPFGALHCDKPVQIVLL